MARKVRDMSGTARCGVCGVEAVHERGPGTPLVIRHKADCFLNVSTLKSVSCAEEEPIQVEDIVDLWMECRAAGDKRWTKLACRALHGSVDDPVTSDAWEKVAEEIIKRRQYEAELLDDMRH